MDRRIVIGAVLLVMAVAGPVLAGFGAADLIYIPVASHNPGAGGTQWRTDLYITNVDDTAVDVAIAYLPSGLVSNSYVFQTRDTWLGGRESDDFGFINEELADIPVNGTVVLQDLIGEYWVDRLGANGNGALVIAVYEADTLEPDGTRVYKNGIANARIYNKTTIWVEDPNNPGELIEKAGQYGQTMPGVPWYNLADGGAVGDGYDLTYEELTGGQEGSGLRFNVGVVNASDPLTSLTVSIQPFQPNGEPYLDADEQEIMTVLAMPPASQTQLFRPFRDDWDLPDVDVATVRVTLVAWASAAADPIPMMSSYGSIVNNNTGDPSSVLPSFAYPYNIDCIWGGGGAGVGKGASVDRRPVEIPPKTQQTEGD
jgi:hypothetical protein